MATWYRASLITLDIVQVEVIRETNDYVQLEDSIRRHAKTGDMEGYFPTFSRAKAWMVAKTTNKIFDLQERLTFYTDKLRKIEQIKEQT